MTFEEACRILEVSENADLCEIEAQFDEKMIFYNPENFQDEAQKHYAEKKLIEIVDAWEFIQKNYRKSYNKSYYKNDNYQTSVAQDEYLLAKKRYKRDLIVVIVMVSVMIIAAAIILGRFFLSDLARDDLQFGDKVEVFGGWAILSIMIGTIAGTLIPGWILAFRFIWGKFGAISIILLILAYVFGAVYGWLITLIYLIVGKTKISKMRNESMATSYLSTEYEHIFTLKAVVVSLLIVWIVVVPMIYIIMNMMT